VKSTNNSNINRTTIHVATYEVESFGRLGMKSSANKRISESMPCKLGRVVNPKRYLGERQIKQGARMTANRLPLLFDTDQLEMSGASFAQYHIHCIG